MLSSEEENELANWIFNMRSSNYFDSMPIERG